MPTIEETVTTEERINPDGSKTIVTKTKRKTPATINGGTAGESYEEGNPDGTPRDGGTDSGAAPGKAVCCLPILCTIM